MGRKLLAQKLSALSFLFEPSQVFESLWPLLQTLWNDDVAEVREATISAPAALIVQLNGSGHPEWAKSIINQLVVMARAHTWLPRLLFCRSCHALVTAVEPDMFIENFLPLVMELGSDKVANVRLALVGVLEAALEVPALSNLEEVNRLLMTMTKDSDSDVSRASQYA